MRFLRNLLDRQARHFEKGGKLEKLYPLYEANDTFLFTPGEVTKGASHVRDGLDLKRMMMTVVIALAGCVYNGDVQHRLPGSPGHRQRRGPTGHVADRGHGGHGRPELQPRQPVGLPRARGALLRPGAAGDVCRRGRLGGSVRGGTQAPGHRRIPGDRHVVPAHPATGDSAVAGRHRDLVRGRDRQGDLRWGPG